MYENIEEYEAMEEALDRELAQLILGPPAEPSGNDYNFDGTGELTIGNLEGFLKTNGYFVRFNDITHEIEMKGFRGESDLHIRENAPALIFDRLHFSLKRCSEQRIASFLKVLATRNRYNPILEKLEGVKWDGIDRIAEIYRIFGIGEGDTLSRRLIRKWLLQCICGLHNTIEEPFSLDIVLIFQGRQGIGKTRFFERLCFGGKYFGEGMTLDTRNKDSMIQATSKWIVELGEIGSTMRKDIDSLKAALTAATDEYRAAYDRSALRYPRMTSFCGTCNDERFLLDGTGNRRFATISLKGAPVIDFGEIQQFDSLQLWAQVHEIVENAVAQGASYGSLFRLDKEELEELDERNFDHVKPLKGEQEVMDILAELEHPEPDYEIVTEEMTTTDFKKRYAVLNKFSAGEVGRVLEKMGYPQILKKIDGRMHRIRSLPVKRFIGMQP